MVALWSTYGSTYGSTYEVQTRRKLPTCTPLLSPQILASDSQRLVQLTVLDSDPDTKDVANDLREFLERWGWAGEKDSEIEQHKAGNHGLVGWGWICGSRVPQRQHIWLRAFLRGGRQVRILASLLPRR